MAQGCRTGVSVREQPGICRSLDVVDPDFTRELFRISEEQKRSSRQRDIEDIHARTAEHFLRDDDRKGYRQCHHPQRTIHRHDQRDEHARHQVAFVDAVSTHPSEEELNAQANAVAHDHQRQDLHRSNKEFIPQRGHQGVVCGDFADGQQVLVPLVPCAEQQGGNQRHNDHEHRALQVHSVADVHAIFGRVSWGEGKRFQRIVDHPELAQFAALLKMWANRIQ